MPRETVWFLRAALAHLVLGSLLGSVLLVARDPAVGVGAVPPLAAHREVALVGWMAQLTFGVAYWILPRHATGAPRGRSGPVWLGWALLNTGTVLIAADGVAATGVLGRVAVVTAAVILVGALAPRIKAFGAGRPEFSKQRRGP